MLRKRQNELRVSAGDNNKADEQIKSGGAGGSYESSNKNVPSAESHTRRYVIAVILLAVYISPFILTYIFPSLQAQIIFMPMVSWPPFLNLSQPESVGLQNTRNFYIKSDVGINLGVWHILPKSLRRSEIGTPEQFIEALSKKPIFIYYHGNAGTRGGWHRVKLCNLLSEMDYNVVTFDYRGFGDSTNENPTAAGLIDDAKSVFSWVKKQVPQSHPVFVWGHSMGTAVTSRFVSEITEKGEKPTGVVLESGFNHVKSAMLNYPLSRLWNFLPFFESWLDMIIRTQNIDFASEERVKGILSPLLMLHAQDDITVKIELGRILRNAAESSRSKGSYFKYVEFSESHQYGHKYICNDPNLPNLIREFVAEAITQQ